MNKELIEEWKDIEGYEGKYQISNYGYVKSLAQGNPKKVQDRILKFGKNHKGYLRAVLYQNGKRKYIAVHKLVAQTFLFDYDSAKQIDHKDLNRLNNRVGNLRMCTQGQNQGNSPKITKKCSSIFKGVRWRKDNRKWSTHITYDHKTYVLGCFTTQIKAAKAYDRKAIELFGEFVYTNEKNGLYQQYYILLEEGKIGA